MKYRRRHLAGLALLATASSSVVGATNIVSDPGFESVTSFKKSALSVSAPSYLSDNVWQVTSGAALLYNSSGNSHTGIHSVNPNSLATSGSLQQVVPTVTGQSYDLSFYYTLDRSGPMLVTLGGVPVTFGAITTSGSFVQAIALGVTATANSEPLVFSTTAGSSILDDVSMTASVAQTFSGSAGTGAWDIGNTVNFTSGSSATTYTDGVPVTFDDAHNTGSQFNITLDATGATVNPGYLSPGLVYINTAGTYNFSGAGLAGTSGILKTGVGTAALSDVNIQTGATNINQGVLKLTPTGSIAKSPVIVGLNNGTTATLEIQASTGSSILNQSLPSLTIANGSAILDTASAPASRTVLVTPALSVSTTGKLDLNNNDLIVQGTSTTLTSVTSALFYGYNGGTWNGVHGILSSVAATDPTHLTALGVMRNTNGTTPIYPTFDNQPSTINDVLVKFTYYGDANLSGIVDSADYTQIDAGFLSQTSPTPLGGWYNGDFNYDNRINGSDYTLIDNAFNMQGSGVVGATAEIAAETAPVATLLTAASAVPEPASLALIGICSVGVLSRRRRKL